MSYDCNMEIVGDGTVRFRGVDFEGRKLTVHKKQGDIIVIKVSGGSCWARIGERHYVPAEFVVYRIIKEHGRKKGFSGVVELTVDRVIDFPIKREAT
jgi:hypothetical protein